MGSFTFSGNGRTGADGEGRISFPADNVGANLATLAHPARRRFHWQDVRAGLPAGFDAVVSNPPFHVDGVDDPRLGRDFIAAAAAANGVITVRIPKKPGAVPMATLPG